MIKARVVPTSYLTLRVASQVFPGQAPPTHDYAMALALVVGPAGLRPAFRGFIRGTVTYVGRSRMACRERPVDPSWMQAEGAP
jgi:hypothetical protein